MKLSLLQPFDSGHAVLNVRVTSSTTSTEFSLTGNGEQLRSVLLSLESTLSTEALESLIVTNVAQQRFCQSIVECVLPSRVKPNVQSLSYLRLTLTSKPKSLSETTSDGYAPPEPLQEEASVLMFDTDGSYVAWMPLEAFLIDLLG